MNVQQHERIARIKQFSRYLYMCLTWIRYFLWIVWPLAVLLVVVTDKGQFTIGSASFSETDFTYLYRVGFVVFISATFFLLLKLTYHFRELIRHFADGDIFNKTAIEHARKALLHGMVIYALYVSAALVGWVLNFIQNSPSSVSINGDFIFWLMLFGVMYVLLWALEIGCDLNEESELTI